jgi:hypothetical protein
MAQLTEQQQIGKRESFADLIAVAEIEKTPYTAMLEKRKRPDQMDHSWQIKGYRVAGHKGVIDGVDATNFNSTPRKRIHCYSQKIWDPVAVSDLAEESDVAGVNKGEMAAQIADAFVTAAQIIERRCLSRNDTLEQNAPANGYETRGAFSWLSNTAQTTFPVPEAFRPNSAQVYSSTLALFTESALLSLGRAAFKRRKGPTTLKGIVGIDLKAAVSNFTRYDDTVGGKTAVRRFNQNADDKAVVNVIDRLVCDTGTIELHTSSFLATDPDSGEDTDYTHRSGVFIDMEMAGLAYTRLPRVFKLPYQGGGHKAVVDAIFLHQLDNVVGMFKAEISADS